MPSFHHLVIAATSIVVTWAGVAHAQERPTIKDVGDHPVYPVEVEPHVVAGFTPPLNRYGTGVGLGGRFSVPVIQNGFVRTINDNVALGFGFDWIHYDQCYTPDAAGCHPGDSYLVPAVMQWNFFLSRHWSVFPEAGLAFNHSRFGRCFTRDPVGNVFVNDCSATGLDALFFLGGRFHASNAVALTMRVGYPYASIGGSFL